MAIQDAEDSDNEDDPVLETKAKPESTKAVPMSKRILHEVEWEGKPEFEYKGRSFYNVAKVGKHHKKLKFH